MEDPLALPAPNSTADICNMKIKDTDIFSEGLNETPLPAGCICIS